MIAIIGSNGAMGKRYQAILDYLYEPYRTLDREYLSEDEILEQAPSCDRIIIASPTGTHVHYLRELLPARKPILCEEPITKDIEQLEELHAFCARNGYSYNMVCQYRELTPISRGDTEYDYYKHGEDSLLWDCIQIVALARQRILLNDKSPIWRCKINGTAISIADMDKAYVTMIQRWIAGTLDQSMDEILHAHKKVAELTQLRMMDV